MFTTPQDFFKVTQDYFNFLPKNEQEVKEVVEKVKTVYITEAKKAAEVYNIYQKAQSGDTTINELATANKKFQNLMVTARFAAFLTIPGAIFTVPALAKFAEEIGIDIIPESVTKEFNL